ncbi:MAG: hypothetical protein JST82_11530 [Bacteroidetes bacterium]|nr:hypothetical protein [Bacteroidota bacterium]
MRKTLVYIVLLAIVGFGAYYFVFSEHDAFKGNESAFNIADTANVGKLFLADKRGNKITIERKETGWVIDNKYAAMQTSVNTLLGTLAAQQPVYPAPKQARENVIREMAGNAIKIEVYSKSGDKMRVFYVGGQAINKTGSYMLMEGSEQPYLVQIPGFEGYLTPRYATELKSWRDRVVFDIPRDELATVVVEYPEEALNNYTYRQDKVGEYAVDIDKALSNGKALNMRRATVYSKFFEKVYCEGYLNGVHDMDSVIASVKKRCSVEATDRKGKTQHIDIYWMPINKRSKNMLSPTPGMPAEFDADRFYAVINNAKDTVVIQNATFEKILRMGYEFYTPDDTSTMRFEVSKWAGNTIKKSHK